jgi:hypothetical protein
MEEWHPQYAFNKSRASDDSTKNHRPFFSVSTVISNPGLDKFSYANLHDVATILLMTKQMIESMKKSGEDARGCFEYA